MTSAERAVQIREEIAYILVHGSYSDIRELQVRVFSDLFGGQWFKLEHRNKFVAIVTPSKHTVHIRKDTIYRDQFEEYAKRVGYRVVLVADIKTPARGLPFSIGRRLHELVREPEQALLTTTRASRIQPIILDELPF